ncbi:MAG: DegT/DnrJ/EryC1/StrS family aminotransferase [Elusimicrobiota bacterium]|nr:DegT/DnrJ/EryC1/StrS family aminotransferase [Elusimicrobiota bacterium]
MAFIREAFRTNWIGPLGPHVAAFEKAFAARVGARHAVAVSSGTAALHLSLRALKLRPGEEVLCSSFTFAATANAITYDGGVPVFIDSDRATWNMDPALLAAELDRLAKKKRLPRAVIAVDLYGQCADYRPIAAACRRHGVPLIEDAAEALGATYRGRSAGTFGWAGVFSFNGNKIITTSSGGMLVTDDGRLARHARFLATQARDDAPHYQHSHIGFNYRMSNVLAGIGLGQLAVLDRRVAARRRVFARYREALGGLPGVTFMPEAPDCFSTHWLTCVLFDAAAFGASREEVRLALAARDVEARPLWKPMHLQPVFKGRRMVGGAVCEDLFARGLCLPSGSNLTEREQERVIAGVLSARKTRRRR